MAGKKAAVAPLLIASAVFNFGDIVVYTDDDGEKKNHVLTEECLALESWDRENKRRKSKLYVLISNPHLGCLDVGDSENRKSLPVLKNGSRFKELKSCKTPNITGKVVLSNTCAFDTVATLIMVSYCDSKSYADNVDVVRNNPFFRFVSDIVKHGIKSSTYSERANLITRYMDVNIVQSVHHDVTLAECDTTAVYVITKMLHDFPSAVETKMCSNNKCPGSKHPRNNVMFITYQVNSNTWFEELQTFVNNRVLSENTRCVQDCTSTIYTDLSNMHLFIDILFWEEEGLDFNVEQSTEASKIVLVKLCDIPQTLISKNVVYELRGVISFLPGKSQLRNSVGHYQGYANRGGDNWELFDDLQQEPISVKSTTLIPCELLLYTI